MYILINIQISVVREEVSIIIVRLYKLGNDAASQKIGR